MEPVLERERNLRLDGVTINVRWETLPRDVVWSSLYDEHLLLVNLGGRTERMDARLERRGRYLGPPTLGEMSVIPAGHRFGGTYGGGNIVYAQVVLSPAFFRLEALPARLMYFDRRIFEPVRQLSVAAADPKNSNFLACEEAAEALARAIGSIGTSIPASATTPFSAPVADRLQEFIHASFSEPIGLADLAGVAAVPVHQLLRRFCLTFGLSPSQYVIEQRIRHGRWLLAHTSLGIAEIAHSIGFSSQPHFTTTFLQRTGWTPAQFRLLSA